MGTIGSTPKIQPSRPSGSGGSGPNPIDALGPLKITAGDTNATPSEGVSLGITAPDTNAVPTDALGTLKIAGLGDANLVPIDGLGPLQLAIADSSALATDAFSAILTALYADSSATPADALGALSLKGLGDSNATPTDGHTLLLRYFGTGATTNDATTGQTVVAANTNGQPDGVFAVLKTGTGTADTTNPVTITTAAMSAIPSVAFTSAKLRVWFKFPGATGAWTDGVVTNPPAVPNGSWIGYIVSGVQHPIWWPPANATVNPPAEDHSDGSFTFDVSGLTLAQLQSLQFYAQYKAAVVLVPQSSIQIDAWCVELTTSL